MSDKLRFDKYTALGNDMIVIDPATFPVELTTQRIQKICDRHFGIGADGICYGPLSKQQPFVMQFFNPDGTEAEKSGNGLRIFARYLCDAGYVNSERFQILINNDVSFVTVLDSNFRTFRIYMGIAKFLNHEIPAIGENRQIVDQILELEHDKYYITCVNVGNPHCVIFTETLDVAEVKDVGRQIEHHPMFPQRVNVQWVRVIDEHTIQIEIWERGAGYTLASGTSSCATACASIINGFCESPITVQMAGGTALVTVDDNWSIELIGDVQQIAYGYFSNDLVESW